MRGCVPTRAGGSSVRARSAISNYLRIAFGARGCIRISQDARRGWRSLANFIREASFIADRGGPFVSIIIARIVNRVSGSSPV